MFSRNIKTCQIISSKLLSTMSNDPCKRRTKVPAQSRLKLVQDAFTKMRIPGRLGAISGALALIVAGYTNRDRILGPDNSKEDATNRGCHLDGGHTTVNLEVSQADRQKFLLAANQLHLYHSLALMAVPHAAKAPILTTSLLMSGIALYCGTQYYRTLNRDTLYDGEPLVWLGGLSFIAAWITFLL